MNPMRKLCVAVVSLLIWPEIDREGREGGVPKCRQICGLGCVNHVFASAWVSQPSPHIFLQYLYEEREMNVGTSPPWMQSAMNRSEREETNERWRWCAILTLFLWKWVCKPCSPGKFYLCEVPETSSFSENSSVSRKKKQLDHFFGCCTANS